MAGTSESQRSIVDLVEVYETAEATMKQAAVSLLAASGPASGLGLREQAIAAVCVRRKVTREEGRTDEISIRNDPKAVVDRLDLFEETLADDGLVVWVPNAQRAEILKGTPEYMRTSQNMRTPLIHVGHNVLTVLDVVHAKVDESEAAKDRFRAPQLYIGSAAANAYFERYVPVTLRQI